MRRWVSVAMIASLSSQGCTVLGLGIGSSVPRYSSLPASAADTLPLGTSVELSSRAGSSGETAEATGLLLRREGDFVYVQEAGEPEQRIARSGISGVTRQGSYWLTGLLVGIVMDAAFATILFFEYKNAAIPTSLGSL